MLKFSVTIIAVSYVQPPDNIPSLTSCHYTHHGNQNNNMDICLFNDFI